MSGWMTVFLMISVCASVLAVDSKCATPGAAHVLGVLFGTLFLVALLSRFAGRTGI